MMKKKTFLFYGFFAGGSLLLPVAHDVAGFQVAAARGHASFSVSFDGDGPINVTENGVAVKGYDVVAYFTEEKPVKGSSERTVEYQDATFHFSSEANKKKFLQDPKRYIPAYGGYCALGVSNGYKDDMHPEAFSILEGRLYFNLRPDIHRYWKRNHEHFIARADAKWPQLKEARGHGPTDGR